MNLPCGSFAINPAQMNMSECIDIPKMTSNEECKAALDGLEKAGLDMIKKRIKQHPYHMVSKPP
jgi:hypothetical protein